MRIVSILLIPSALAIGCGSAPEPAPEGTQDDVAVAPPTAPAVGTMKMMKMGEKHKDTKSTESQM